MSRRWGRRRRGRLSLTRKVKQYLLAFLFIILIPAVLGLASWIISVIPERNLTIGNINISNTAILGILLFAVTLIVFLVAMRKLGISL
ncbi:MAG: hypothetical protein QW607_04425 [Desulfurococcaceae archaeon]